MWFRQETLVLRNGVEMLKGCKRENIILQDNTHGRDQQL